MMDVGLEKLETYIIRIHNTVAQYISNRPILDLCMEAEKSLGTRVETRWWW